MSNKYDRYEYGDMLKHSDTMNNKGFWHWVVYGGNQNMTIKGLLYMLSSIYLALTFWLFLSDASLNELLLYAIYTYILYTPLVGLFSRPDQLDQFAEHDYNGKQHEYLIRVSVFILIVGSILLFTQLIHANSLLSIAKAFLDGIPSFSMMEFISGYFESVSLIVALITIILALVFWPVTLAFLGIMLIVWLVSFVFNFLLHLLVFFIYVAAVLWFLYMICNLAYSGYKNSREYVKGDIRVAIYILSTITTGLYVSGVLFANLVIMY